MATAGDASLCDSISPTPETDGEIRAGVMLGEFRVEGVLGEGGMATIYSAVHPLIGKRVAIKVISQALSRDAAAVKAFLQEARDVNQIRHRNIVDIFAFGSLPDGRSYFVMEWLEGQSLRSSMLQETLSLGDNCQILIQVCDALDAVHEKGIVHLDLKPDNVFLVPVRGGGTLVKLLDFGIARLFEAELSPQIEQTVGVLRMIPGTPAYMSPEQAQGRQVNQRSDAYSMGVMAFEMFLGRRPFLSESGAALLHEHVTTPPPRPSALWSTMPPALDALIVGLLEKHPTQRTTLAAARAALSKLADASLQVRTTRNGATPSAAPRRGTPQGKRRSLAAAVAVSAAALMGGVGWSQLGHRAPGGVAAAAEKRSFAERPAPGVTAIATRAEAPHGGILRVTVAPSTARFTVDGVLVADGARAARIPLEDDALHVLSVTAHGYRDYQRHFSMKGGRVETLAVRLGRVPPARARDGAAGDYIIDSSGRAR